MTDILIRQNSKIQELLDLINSAKIRPGNETRYHYVQQFAVVAPIQRLCRLFSVGRTSYYDWLKRKDKPDPDLAIRDLIIRVRQDSQSMTMGYRKITDIIQKDYFLTFNHKKIYRIMKKYGLLSVALHSKKMSVLYRGIKPYRNKINRKFNSSQLNQCWCIDITKLDSEQGRQYLCAIIDLYDRSIVSYRIHNTQTVRLVKDTVENALKANQYQIQPNIVLHSDQGKVFKSGILKRFLNDTPITQSMSAKATPVDNAVIESFFASLKKECIYINDFETHEDIILGVIDFIYYYNFLRPHHFNGCTPAEKRSLLA